MGCVRRDPNPGRDLVLLLSWRDAAEAGERKAAIPDGARVRRVRIVREYGMFERREAPQFYPDVARASSTEPMPPDRPELMKVPPGKHEDFAGVPENP